MTYRMDRSYRWNYQHGPQLTGSYPAVPEVPPQRFLDRSVRSLFGISAGLLLNSRWIECYARLGFDLLTYKTVRSHYRPCHPLPNWVYVQADAPLDLDDVDAPLRRLRRRPRLVGQLTTAVCFGMPSTAPEEWRADVERARDLLGKGQLLIVSVVGTPGDPPDQDSLAADYALCARWAAEAGAHIVEANLSCPNVCTAEGSIYLDPVTTRIVTEALRDALPGTPLLLKAGHFENEESLERFFEVVKPLADGVELVNGIQRRVLESDGTPSFGPDHERVGILGWAIRPRSLLNVQMARQVAPDLAILAVGGVATSPDAAAYFKAGADAVMMGSAPMFNPYLAVELKQSLVDSG